MSQSIKMADRRMREAQLKTQITQKLSESGEKERLKQLLKKRLRECGWKDQLREYCKSIIREKGLERVTVEMLVNEVTPKARGSVPEEVKRELLQEIRDYLQSQP